VKLWTADTLNEVIEEVGFKTLQKADVQTCWKILQDLSEWIHNLTEEGVEPNPGPEMKVTFDEIAATRFPTNKDVVRGDLKK